VRCHLAIKQRSNGCLDRKTTSFTFRPIYHGPIPIDTSATKMASISNAIRYQLPWTQRRGRYRGRHAPGSLYSPENEKSSLDFTQRIERKLAEYNSSGNVFKRWLFEMMSWLISASCMIAIVCIYLRIKGHPLSQDGSYLTWTNVLGKVSSAALIVPTSEALGQLKWHWFHKSNAMWDFEIFDKASRGPLGAMMLLFRTKGRSLAALGALLIVLLLAIDTFFQQVVSYPDQWMTQFNAGSIPRVVRYEPLYAPETFQGFETNFVDPAFRDLIGRYFAGNGTHPTPFANTTRPDIPLSCPTSICNWPSYDTLGVCSECVQATDLMQYACLETKVDWTATHGGPIEGDPYPVSTVCGYFLNSTSKAPVLMSGYVVGDGDELPTDEALLVRVMPLTDMLTKAPVFGGSINFRHLRNPILDTLIVSAKDGPDSVYRNETPVAHECVLAWCVKTIVSSYAWGQYNETISAVYLNETDESWPWPWQSYSVEMESENGTMTIFDEDITITPPRSARINSTAEYESFSASNTTASNIMIGFDDFFPSYYTAIKGQKPKLRYKNYPDGPSLRKLAFNPLLSPNNVTHHMERLATAMTNVIRSSVSVEMISGDALSPESVISIQWEWLSLPLLLLLLSLVFLVLTIIKTSRDTETGVWKTSVMPTLIYSLPKEAQGQFREPSTWNTARDTKKIRIRLLPKSGWRVSGQSYDTTSPQPPRPAVQAPRGWI
jgi:hypothetical protein